MNPITSPDWTTFIGFVQIAQEDHGRLEEVYDLMRQIEREPEHVCHVARLASSLYDQTHSLHRLSDREKFLLVSAALLHDTGWSFSPDGRGHHKLSQKLILEHRWSCFSLREKSVVANVARYHRRALPHDGHPHFHLLSREDQSLVSVLASLLRVADALDRTHLQIVESLECRVNPPSRTDLLLSARRQPDDELAAVAKKKDLFERVFNCQLLCQYL